MRIEVDNRDGAVGAVDGAQEGEGYGVIAAEGDDSGKCLAVLRGTFLFGVCGRGAGEDAVVTFFDLVEGPGVIVSVTSVNTRLCSGGNWEGSLRSNRDITTIQDGSPAIEWVRFQRYVVSSTETNPA